MMILNRMGGIDEIEGSEIFIKVGNEFEGFQMRGYFLPKFSIPR